LKYVKRYYKSILLLFAIDQIVKIIIYYSLFNYNFDIIRGLINFRPIINTNLSWPGNFLNIFSNPVFLYIINILLFILFISGYSFYRSKVHSAGKWATRIFIFGVAGCICSLIDKLFWGGSLDFIQITGLFTFDLKDCYLTISEIAFLFICLKNHKKIKLKEYLNLCLKCSK
jgi:signal peptidase II